MITRSNKHKINDSITNLSNKKPKYSKRINKIVLDSDSESESEIESIDYEQLYHQEFNLLQHFIYSISDGSFFELNDQENIINHYKNKISLENLQLLNTKLSNLKNDYDKNNIDLVQILNNNYPIEKQKLILESLYNLINSDILTPEYKFNLFQLKNLTNTNHSESKNVELDLLEKEILDNINNYNNSYKNQILTSNMSFNNKVIAYKYLKIMESYDNSSSEELIKYKTWLNTLLNIPFGKYVENEITIESHPIEIDTYINKVRQILDQNLSYLEKPKDQIINIIAHMVRNPTTHMNGIGIYGPKGIGKSSLIESIGKSLNRPVVRISLGGSNDANLLNGHSFTYIGSRPGKIIDAIINSKVMNCIIHIDEIDKVAQNEQGKEIFNTLLHLTDSTTNNKYNCDNYFSGIELDLSRVLFIFTYNNPENVDSIFADRIYKINISNYSPIEQFEIVNKHLISNVLKTFNFNVNEVTFTDKAIKYIIEKSKGSDGMRTIKNNIQVIVSRINTLLLTKNSPNNVINLSYKKLYNYYKTLPVIIVKKHIDILLEDSLYQESNNHELAYQHIYL
jgi:ATP-dependent Lon protease